MTTNIVDFRLPEEETVAENERFLSEIQNALDSDENVPLAVRTVASIAPGFLSDLLFQHGNIVLHQFDLQGEELYNLIALEDPARSSLTLYPDSVNWSNTSFADELVKYMRPDLRPLAEALLTAPPIRTVSVGGLVGVTNMTSPATKEMTKGSTPMLNSSWVLTRLAEIRGVKQMSGDLVIKLGHVIRNGMGQRKKDLSGKWCYYAGYNGVGAFTQIGNTNIGPWWNFIDFDPVLYEQIMTASGLQAVDLNLVPAGVGYMHCQTSSNPPVDWNATTKMANQSSLPYIKDVGWLVVAMYSNSADPDGTVPKPMLYRQTSLEDDTPVFGALNGVSAAGAHSSQTLLCLPYRRVSDDREVAKFLMVPMSSASGGVDAVLPVVSGVTDNVKYDLYTTNVTAYFSSLSGGGVNVPWTPFWPGKQMYHALSGGTYASGSVEDDYDLGPAPRYFLRTTDWVLKNKVGSLLPLVCAGAGAGFALLCKSLPYVDTTVWSHVFDEETPEETTISISIRRYVGTVEEELYAISPVWLAEYYETGFGLYKPDATATKQYLASTTKDASLFGVWYREGEEIPVDVVERLDLYQVYKKARDKACLSNDFMRRPFVGAIKWSNVDAHFKNAKPLHMFGSISIGAPVASLLRPITNQLQKYMNVIINYSAGTGFTTQLDPEGLVDVLSIDSILFALAGGARRGAGLTDAVLTQKTGYVASELAQIAEQNRLVREVSATEHPNSHGRGFAVYDFQPVNLSRAGFPRYRDMTQQDAYKLACVSEMCHVRTVRSGVMAMRQFMTETAINSFWANTKKK